MNPALESVSRADRRRLLASEARARKTGQWGEWECADLPDGLPTAGGGGWCKQIRRVHRNRVFAVLERPLAGGEVHLAVSSLSGVRPTWREMQRIKNELLGPDATAVEVYPPEAEVVDEADMFHIWSQLRLSFTIFGGAS